MNTTKQNIEIVIQVLINLKIFFLFPYDLILSTYNKMLQFTFVLVVL